MIYTYRSTAKRPIYCKGVDRLSKAGCGRGRRKDCLRHRHRHRISYELSVFVSAAVDPFSSIHRPVWNTQSVSSQIPVLRKMCPWERHGGCLCDRRREPLPQFAELQRTEAFHTSGEKVKGLWEGAVQQVRRLA